MSSDKRTVTTDALETLGTIIDEFAGRDAIHLAVIPQIAAEELYPGQDVGIEHGAAVHTGCSKFLGIVDPFLKEPVRIGQRFWLVVYPRQITSLRHVWSHPEFEEAQDTVLSDQDLAIVAQATERLSGNHRQWITEFAERNNTHFDTVMNGAREWLDSGGYLCLSSDINEYVSDEFWEHYEFLTGQKVHERSKENFFTCAC